MDKIRILEMLRTKGPSKLSDLKQFVEEANGNRDKHWDFYYVIRQMEDQRLLTANYDPAYRQTIARISQSGSDEFDKLGHWLSEIYSLLPALTVKR